jgi:hypothetical protein
VAVETVVEMDQKLAVTQLQIQVVAEVVILAVQVRAHKVVEEQVVQV